MMRQNRKIVIQQLGESFRDCTTIVDEPVSEPGPGEVLVRHHFAGVNGVYDQMMCLDRVEHTRVVPPADAGVEAVGVIESVGKGVAGHDVGDPVAIVKAGKGYRSRQVCQAEDLIPVPAASPESLTVVPSGVSALVALEQVGQMGQGETVCITAAAGGLGNVMTQLAVRAGNHVIAICGSPDKAAWLRAIGVQRVINYREEDASEVLGNEYPDAIDLAMDSVGGSLFDALVDQLAPHGRLVVCGYTSDRLPTRKVNAERIYTHLYWKAASVRGFMNWRYSSFAEEARERLFSLLSTDELLPLVNPTPFLGLESVADAVDQLLAGQTLGKVVVNLKA